MAPSALDRVVRNLVEEGHGESSEDFDRRVADLIVAEAREKNKFLLQSKSSLEQSSRRQTTNTRFLTNVVRGVQSHNRAVLSIPAEAEQRLTHDTRKSLRDVEGESRGDSSGDGKKRSRMRGWSEDEVEGSRRNKEGRSSSSRHEDTSERSERHHTSSKERKEKETHSHKHREKDRDEDRRRRKRSQSPRRHKSKSESSTIGASQDLPPSKMDRYFDEKYDPVLDVRAETREDENGLIEDDGWERMLQAVKDKEQRKRARKERGKDHRREEDKAPRVGIDVMQTQYTSRGKLREWDKGKEILD